MKASETVKRYILLVIGVFFIGLGIAAAKGSDLGISPVSSVANVISIKFDFFTVGTWLFLWNCLLIVFQIMILRRGFAPIQFLQIPVSLLLGVFTDIGVALFSFISAESYIIRLILVLIGVLLIGFGITLTVISNTVMNVGEAFVDVVSKKTGKNFGTVKVVFDVTCVLCSVVLSLIFFDFTVIGTREGTVITALSTGNVVRFLNKKLTKPILKLMKLK